MPDSATRTGRLRVTESSLLDVAQNMAYSEAMKVANIA
jgi:hypothetical protein